VLRLAPLSEPVQRLAIVLLLGCSVRPSLTVGRTDKPAAHVEANAEDGSKYVRVEGGMLSSRDGLSRQWKGAAKRACDGEYQVLSDAGFERRKAGVVVARTHEGYVRCILPDLEDAPASG
jgi:hypothetical protein